MGPGWDHYIPEGVRGRAGHPAVSRDDDDEEDEDSMIAKPLQTTLEATGYLLDGQPAEPGVALAGAATPPRLPRLAPDAWWRRGLSGGSSGSAGVSNLTVFFKFTERPDGRVADWQREVWNFGFAPLLWVVSPDRTDVYNGFGTPPGNPAWSTGTASEPSTARRSNLKSWTPSPDGWRWRRASSGSGRGAWIAGPGWTRSCSPT